jgi:hypothetical protein
MTGSFGAPKSPHGDVDRGDSGTGLASFGASALASFGASALGSFGAQRSRRGGISIRPNCQGTAIEILHDHYRGGPDTRSAISLPKIKHPVAHDH